MGSWLSTLGDKTSSRQILALCYVETAQAVVGNGTLAIEFMVELTVLERFRFSYSIRGERRGNTAYILSLFLTSLNQEVW